MAAAVEQSIESGGSSTPTPAHPKTMKAAILHKNGDPTTTDVLSVVDNVPIPISTAGQLLVKVHAAAINPVDWKLCKGDFPGLKRGTFGSDVCGTVVSIDGTGGAVPFKVGEVIYADAIGTMGSFAEYMVVDAHVATKKSVNLTDAEAASLPLAGLTALQGLRNHGKFKKGQKVLILGGSGGVGSLAVQMAKALGASNVTATGSDVDLIRGLGADVVVDYKTEPLLGALAGKNFDIVFDTIGGREHWKVGRAALKRKGGIFLTIVGDGDSSLLVTLLKATWRNLSAKVFGGPQYRIFLTDTKYDGVKHDMATITELVESGKVKPLLDERRFQLTTEGVHDLIKASMSHRAKGKLILQVVEE